jgi:hypothetical protein
MGEEKAQEFNGEWHLGRYLGMFDDVLESTTTKDSFKSSRALVGSEELCDAMTLAEHTHRADMDVLLEGASKMLPPSAAPPIDDSCVSGVVETKPGDMTKDCSLKKIFQAQAAFNIETEEIWVQDEVDAQRFEMLKKGMPDTNLVKFEVHSAKTIALLSARCGPWSMLRCRISKAFCHAGDAEMKSAIESGQAAVTSGNNDHKAFTEQVEGKTKEYLESASSSDVEVFKKAVADLTSSFMTRTVANIRKASTGIRSTISKLRCKASKDTVAMKAQRTQVSFDIADIADEKPTNAEYVFSAIWMKDKAEIRVGSKGSSRDAGRGRRLHGCISQVRHTLRHFQLPVSTSPEPEHKHRYTNTITNIHTHTLHGHGR